MAPLLVTLGSKEVLQLLSNVFEGVTVAAGERWIRSCNPHFLEVVPHILDQSFLFACHEHHLRSGIVAGSFR